MQKAHIHESYNDSLPRVGYNEVSILGLNLVSIVSDRNIDL